MRRRDFLTRGTTAGAALAVFRLTPARAADSLSNSAEPAENKTSGEAVCKLEPPATGKIDVAFVLSDGATIIDFCGPWEVFQDVHVMERGSSMDEHMPFRLYTVSDQTELITATAGMRIMPDFTFANAPPPRVVVVPAQTGRSKAMLAWLREMSQQVDVLMSVCTGAFVLGAAGLLSGKKATTHHKFLDAFAERFPEAELFRGRRFVENAVISTAGGLTSGIDLALHVVERYFGRQVAQNTADFMEYESKGWMT